MRTKISLIPFFLILITLPQSVYGNCSLFKKHDPNQKDVSNAISIIEKSSIQERYEIFENCNLYMFAENILKSKLLSDIQKLDYYTRIQPLYPNNTEMGSVLGYDVIKIFIKYKRKPIKDTVNSIDDPKLKKRIRAMLLDADMIME